MHSFSSRAILQFFHSCLSTWNPDVELILLIFILNATQAMEAFKSSFSWHARVSASSHLSSHMLELTNNPPSMFCIHLRIFSWMYSTCRENVQNKESWRHPDQMPQKHFKWLLSIQNNGSIQCPWTCDWTQVELRYTVLQASVWTYDQWYTVGEGCTNTDR